MPSTGDVRKYKLFAKTEDLFILLLFWFLAETLVTKSKTINNPSDFAMAVDEEFADFQFPDDFIFDIWGAISDSKSGRLQWRAYTAYV